MRTYSAIYVLLTSSLDGTPADALTRTVAAKIGWTASNVKLSREYTPAYDSQGNIVIPDLPYSAGKSSTVYKLRKTVVREAINSAFRMSRQTRFVLC